MHTTLYRLTLAALLLVTTPTLALASWLRVRPAGGESQTVTMCPDCGRPIACAKAGDYTVAVSADMPSKNSGIVRYFIRLTDAAGKPVTGTKVAVVLSMPEHKHQRIARATGGRRGEYTAETVLEPHMIGEWKASVQITSPKGDVVTQAFNFYS